MGQTFKDRETAAATAALSLDGRITVWPLQMEARYGFTAAEAVGHTPAQLLRTIFLQPRAEIDREFADFGTWTGEVIHHDKSGRVLLTATRWDNCPAAGTEPGFVRETHADIAPTALRIAVHFATAVDTLTRDLSEAMTAISTYNLGARMLLSQAPPDLATVRQTALIEADQIRRAAACLHMLRELINRYHLATNPLAGNATEAGAADDRDTDLLFLLAEWEKLEAQIAATFDSLDQAMSYSAHDALLAPLYDRQHDIVSRVCAMRAHTEKGRAARARVITLMERDIGPPDPLPVAAFVDDQARMVQALLHDMKSHNTHSPI